jgi:glucosamine--fructose-6-phosphate aminotransferase (isomerizing)
MCGIFGYSGKENSFQRVLEGLKNLEYRGYDSWGIASIEKNKISIIKDVGDVDIKQKVSSTSRTSIGHTRWATHGGVTVNNAHPHLSTNSEFALVQNGIVENFSQLKKMLEKENFIFKTDTDTEVIVRLIELYLKKDNSLKQSIVEAFKKLHGRNTIMVIDNKGKIYAIRNGSPLVLGIGDDNTFIASDILSFSKYTNQVIYIEDYDMIEVENNNIKIFNLKDNKEKDIHIESVSEHLEDISKDGYDHFMLKEIVEQRECIKRITKYKESDFKIIVNLIRKSNTTYVVGAGTAGFAAGQIAYFLRNISNTNAIDIRSYDFKNYLSILNKKDLIITISQSGETADTIEAINWAKEKGCKIVSIVNMEGSTLSRISDHTIYTKSGPEICVASTKAFTSQVTLGYLISKTVNNEYSDGIQNILSISKDISNMFTEKNFNRIKKLVKKIKEKEHFFILGKGQNTYIALEGALKIKEISYKHFEGFSAGELKHGVIALVEKGTPVFSIISNDSDSKDMISSSEEVHARGAFTIGVGDPKFNNLKCFDYYIPTVRNNDLSCISNVIPFQLISYFLSLDIGNNIDKPRNLAKSVTVK